MKTKQATMSPFDNMAIKVEIAAAACQKTRITDERLQIMCVCVRCVRCVNVCMCFD